MISADRLGFDLSLPWWVIALLATLGAAMLVVYAVRSGRAPWLRGLGLVLLLLGLANPLLVNEVREPSADIVAVIVDRSESLELAGREEAVQRAADALLERLQSESALEVRVREVEADDTGTPLLGALQSALADAPKERIAGAILLSDGQVSDAPELAEALAELGPVHAIVIGDPERRDRRLRLLASPSFAIVGEPMSLEAVVEEAGQAGLAEVVVSVNGAPRRRLRVTPGQPFTVDATLEARGRSIVTLEVEPGQEEISLANNRASFEVTGVRDRLRVLLITGEPHPGARVWRNFLKSDPAVDLVHFTILRPIDKNDDTPIDELALIAFPHRELFDRRLGEFDLIIFDRYRRRGILEYAYFENIARRVEAGGALLVAAGPYDAGPESLNRTPLAAILPSQPTYELREQPFRPAPTSVGQRHPVVRGLSEPQRWGKWNRAIGAVANGGQTLLAADGSPLLVLDRAGKGRVAQLWSDQIWLWARGYDGGGPYAEMMRRLAHWLMQEPELEEERLTLKAEGGALTVERASIGAAPGPVEIIAPDGATSSVSLAPAGPGLWRGAAPATEPGLYEARAGALRSFAPVGPLNPKEASALAATDALLRPGVEASGGGVFFAGEAGDRLPDLRRIRRGERAKGPDWLGLRSNGAYVVRASAARPLGPGALWAALGVTFLLLGWLREGR